MGEIFQQDPNTNWLQNTVDGNSAPKVTGNQNIDVRLASMSPEEKKDYLDKLNAPLNGDEIADLIQSSRDTGYIPTKDEYETYKKWRSEKSSNIFRDIMEGFGGIKDQFVAAGNDLFQHPLITQIKLPASVIEGGIQGTRNFYGMLAQSQDPSSILFRFKNALLADGSDPNAEYNQFLDAMKFNHQSQNLAEGKTTLLMDKDLIDHNITQAASWIADPMMFIPFADVASAGAKAFGMGETLAKLGARTAGFKQMVLGGALKYGAGVPIEFIGSAVRNTIDYTTERGASAFNGLTGVPINDFKATAKLGTLGAAAMGTNIPYVGAISGSYLGASFGAGLGEALNGIGTQIMRGERGIMGYAEMALDDARLKGIPLSPNATNILKIIKSADPLLMYASNIAEGAAHGALIGGALGYLGEGEEGMGGGIGAGIALGGIGALGGTAYADIAGKATEARTATMAKLTMEGWKQTDPEKHAFFSQYYNYIEKIKGNDPKWKGLADKLVAGIDQVAPNVALHLLDPEGYMHIADKLGLDENARVKDATIGTLSEAPSEERSLILGLLKDYSTRYAGRPEDFRREAESDVRELSPKQQELLKTKVEPRPQEPAQLHTDLPYGSQERIDSYNQSMAVKEWDAKYDETHFRNGYSKPRWMLKDVEARPTQYQMPYDQWKRLNPEEQQKVSKKQQDSKWDVQNWDRQYADTHDYTGKPLKGESLYFGDTPDRLANVKSLEQDAINRHESQLREPQGPIKLQAIKQKWGSLSEAGKKAFLDILKEHNNLFKGKTNKESSAYYGDLLAAENARKAVLNAHNGNVDTNQVPDTLKAQKLAKDFLDAERNPDGSLTQRGEMIKTKLRHEGFVDENGNVMQRREAQRLPITLEELQAAKGITTQRDADGKVHIYINSDNMSRDTFPHELFHAILKETAMKDMFMKPLTDKLLGTWENGKQVSQGVVNINEVSRFLDNYYNRLHSNLNFSPEAHKNFMDNVHAAIDEYKNWNNSKQISDKTLTILHNAIEEFGANYFSHWMLDTPPDYLFRGGELTGFRGLVDDVKYAWADYWQSKMKSENPQFDFSGKLEKGFYDKSGNRVQNASLDYMMRDILRATRNLNKGVWSPLTMSPDAVKAYVRGNGMANVIRTDVAGRPKLLKESEAQKLNRAAGIAINKIIEGLSPEDRVGLKKDADGNWTGRLNSKVLDMIVQSGWRDRAWADKVEHAYRIIDGNAENVVEAGYLGATAQTTDASWPRLTGKDVPFKNRKFLLYDVTTKIGPDGTFHVLLHSLDMHVIENRANALWSNQEYRDLWYGNRGAMEADFFKYVQNASKPSSERLQSANLLNNGDGKGAERRNVLHQMLGMAKTDDNPYFNKPIAEIPQGWRQSITTFNIDRMTQMRTRAGERFEYNPENAHIALSHNWSPADMEYENTSNGQILKHDSGFKFIRVGNSTQAFDNLGRNLGSFRTAEEAAKASKKLFDSAVNNQEQGGQRLLEQSYEKTIKFAPALSEKGKQDAKRLGDVYETNEMKAFVKGRPIVAGGLTRQELIKNYWDRLTNQEPEQVKSFLEKRYNEVKDQMNSNSNQADLIRSQIHDIAANFFQSPEGQKVIQNSELKIASTKLLPENIKNAQQALVDKLRLLMDKNDTMKAFTSTYDAYATSKNLIHEMKPEAIQSIIFGHLYDDQIQTGKPFVTTATHGTESHELLTRKIFSEESLGQATECESAKMGTFFAGSQETSKSYASDVDGWVRVKAPKNQLRASIVMDNPLVCDFPRSYSERFLAPQIKKAIAGGHDGIVFKNLMDGGYQETIFCVLKGKADTNIKVIESGKDKVNRVPRGKMPDGSKPISIDKLNLLDNSFVRERLGFSPADNSYRGDDVSPNRELDENGNKILNSKELGLFKPIEGEENKPIRLSGKIKTISTNKVSTNKYEMGEGNRTYNTNSRQWTNGFIGKYAEENPILTEGIKLSMKNWDKRTDDYGRRSIELKEGNNLIGRIDYEIKKDSKGRWLLSDPTVLVLEQYRGKGYSNLLYSEMAERARFLGAENFLQRIENDKALPMFSQVKTFGFGETKLIDADKGQYFPPTKENFDKLKNPDVDIQNQDGSIETVKGYEPWVHSWSKIFSDRHYQPAEGEGTDWTNRIAKKQRGDAEQAMKRVQRIVGGGAINYSVEHSGDILHRTYENVAVNYHKDFGYHTVKNKVTKVSDAISEINRRGFWNIEEENYPYATGAKDKTLEQHKEQIIKALKEFADEHDKLPAENDLQKTVKTINNAIGNLNFDLAQVGLQKLLGKLRSEKSWIKYASEGMKDWNQEKENRLTYQPIDKEPVSWETQNTSAGSIIKNTAGYVIMKSMSKYRIYNPYKALVGVYDDEKTAMDKINKLSRTPNELR